MASRRARCLSNSLVSASDEDIGSVAELLAIFHEMLRRLSHLLRPGVALPRRFDIGRKRATWSSTLTSCETTRTC